MKYKYIQGEAVELDEHMLSATEIANLYGIYSQRGTPNGVMIGDYLQQHMEGNLQYFYPYSHGVMKVYPMEFYSYWMNKLLETLSVTGTWTGSTGKKYKYTVNIGLSEKVRKET